MRVPEPHVIVLSRERLASSEKRLHDLEQTSAKAGSMQTSARLKADKLKKELEEKANLVSLARFGLLFTSSLLSAIRNLLIIL